MRTIRTLIIFTLLFELSRAEATPGMGPPLKLIRGRVYSVATVYDLKQAVETANQAAVPATILIADGEYILDIPMLHILCPGLVIRSESGERDRVVLRGPDEGPEATLRNVFLVPAPDVVIADLTLGWCRWHGIQVQGESPHDASGLRVHNCVLMNCNEQFIKGSSGLDSVGATDGVIEFCHFEFSRGWAYQYYTGGIDIHKGVNWVVRENVFRNLRVPAGESRIAEQAVHFWKRADQPQNIVVERNWIINCDRGIGFGLGSFENGHGGGNSVIRNNFVSNDGAGKGTDVGIGLENANNVVVANNTVYVENYWAPVEYRFVGSTNLSFFNNLVNRPIQPRNEAPEANLTANVTNARPAWFCDWAAGDLHLLPTANSAINQGIHLDTFADDWDGDRRPVEDAWDVGADEYDPKTSDSDGDGMSDGWERNRGLNRLDSRGQDGPDGDPDRDAHSSLDEYRADTHPNDPNCTLRLEFMIF